MSAVSAFGNLVAASDVEQAALAQLQKWVGDYLAEVERYHALDVGALPRPRSWEVSAFVERFPEDQLPAVVLASPGLAEVPLADGAGVYTARWQLVVATQVAARGNRLALRLARLYALALRALLLQQQGLEPLQVRRIDWMDERYRLLDSIDDRSTCVSEVELAVEVYDATTRNAGPLEPLLGPDAAPGPGSPAWPVAVSADVALSPVPITEEP
jgi:phage gp37-like protein